MLEALLEEDAGITGAFLASPVRLSRESVYPVENYGSAMAPLLYHAFPVGGRGRAGGHAERLGGGTGAGGAAGRDRDAEILRQISAVPPAWTSAGSLYLSGRSVFSGDSVPASGALRAGRLSEQRRIWQPCLYAQPVLWGHRKGAQRHPDGAPGSRSRREFPHRDGAGGLSEPVPRPCPLCTA